MLASSLLWQHLRNLHPFEWQRSHLFFSFDSHCMRQDLLCHRMCATVHLLVCVRAGVLLGIYCSTTVLDLLTNHLESAQAWASLHVWVTLLMSSFHAVLCSLARWRCRFTILLLQICVSVYMCRIKPPIEGRWAIHSKRGNTPLRAKKTDSLLLVRNLYEIVLWKWPGVDSSDLHLCPCQEA